MIDKPSKREETIIPKSTETPPKTKGILFTSFIATLALGLSVVGVAAGYKHWQRMHTKVKDNQKIITQLQQDMRNTGQAESVQLQISSFLQQQEAQQANMQGLHQETKQFAQRVTEQISHITQLQGQLQSKASPNDSQAWQIAEVRFLLKLANQQAHLAQNKAAALAALQQADQLLTQISAVNFIPVRQQLSHDIASLERFEPAPITTLSQNITQLMLRLAPKENSQVMPEEHASKDEQSMLPQLDKLFVVTRNNPQLQDALDFQSRQQLYQILQLQLESLRLSLFQKDNKHFQAQLELVEKTLQRYYPSSILKAHATTLSALKSTDLEQAWPDISGSLQQLNSALNQVAGKTQ